MIQITETEKYGRNEAESEESRRSRIKRNGSLSSPLTLVPGETPLRRVVVKSIGKKGFKIND